MKETTANRDNENAGWLTKLNPIGYTTLVKRKQIERWEDGVKEKVNRKTPAHTFAQSKSVTTQLVDLGNSSALFCVALYSTDARGLKENTQS